MKRIALLLMLATLGCRRTHPPGPGAELAPLPATDNTSPPSAAAPDNPPAPPPATANTNPTTAATNEAPAAPVEKRYLMPDGGTLNNDPRGPRPVEVQAILDGALTMVRGCFEANRELKFGEYPVAVHFFVEPPGYTGGVTVKVDAPADVTDCARDVYEKLRFPEFHGKKLELSPTFTWWKRAVGKDGGAR